MKNLLRAGIAMAMIVIGALVIWYFATLDTRPPLTADLKGPWKALSDEFDRRVKARFAIGSPEEQLSAELQRQGFSRDKDSALGQELTAARSEDTWVCRQTARIYWRSDSESRLTAIRGEYGALCL